MSATGRGGDTEPGRALRAPTGPVLSLPPPTAASVFPSPPRWALSVAGARRCVPRPAALYRGPCPPAVGTALLATRLSFGLVNGGEERLDRAKPGDTRHPRPTVCNRHQSQGEQIMSEGALR